MVFFVLCSKIDDFGMMNWPTTRLTSLVTSAIFTFDLPVPAFAPLLLRPTDLPNLVTRNT
jgi:hypothetical protein